MARNAAPLWVRETLRRPHGVFGAVVIAVVITTAIASRFWTPWPLLATDSALRWSPPSPQHWLGTDQIGRDLFSWLFAGSATTVVVFVTATVIAAVVGIALGTLTASLRPRFAEPLVVLVDILVAFPVLLIAILLAAVLGGSIAIVVISVGIGAGLNLARVVRSEIVRVNASDFILASRAAGTPAVRRLIDHVLPNVAPVLVVQLSVSAGIAILAEAGLTFLGYGAEPSQPSWGRVLADAQKYIGVAPAAVIWPGVAIGLTVLALNLLGDAIAEGLDPRLYRREATDGA